MASAATANAIPLSTASRARDGRTPPNPATRTPSADNSHRSATYTVISGSDGDVRVYPNRTSSGGSASADSHTSSRGSRSLSSEESWSEVEFEDDIDPSDSASRSRLPSRRRTVEARPAPSRRHSSRRRPVIVEPEENPPRRQPSRQQQPQPQPPPQRQHSSRRESRHESRPRIARSTSRRVPSDDSSDIVASDDYPHYGHHGRQRAAYAPSSYRPAPAQSHGGYPPSMSAASHYPESYAPPHQALMRVQQREAYGYPQQNPFSPQSQEPNPFSPISAAEGPNYFAADPLAPPNNHQRHHRPEPQPRPQSFVAHPSHYAGGSELIAAFHPGMSPYGQWPGYPPYPVPGWLPAKASTPPPAPKDDKPSEIEAIKELIAKRDAEDEAKKKDEKVAEIESLKKLIEKHEAEAVARQKAWIAEREAEAAAKAAEQAKAEEEKKRKLEIDEARKKAKEDAEKKAEEAAKKAKEEHDKKLAEAEKAKEEADKAKKSLEDEIAKNKPLPDMLKAPIKFKDAVGRKFSFPWHLCKTWKGMETLIKQAFLHVDVIGEHVHQGHYDLTGPDGEIILPQVWETMVQPEWEITMHLWPMEEDKPPDLEPPIDPFRELGLGGHGNFHGHPSMLADLGIVPEMPKKKSGKKGDGKKKAKGNIETVLMQPSIPPPPPQHLPPPSGSGYPDPFAGMGGLPPSIKPPKDKSKSKSKSRGKEISPLAAWLAGGNARPPKKR